MFECRACTLRCIRAIAADAFKPSALKQRSLFAPRSPTHRFQRNASTAVATSARAKNGLVPGKQPIDENDPDGDGSVTRKGTALSSAQKRHLELELQHLPDRVKLAEHVHYTLRREQPEKALNLCRLASKSQEVIVAWNHCIDWHMQRNKIDEAIKIYNEMKKRAQFPDSYTYVLLLRGLAKPHHHGQPVRESNVAKAVNIYNSLSSPTSRVKASIMHTNAVLRVCSAALDMDALWGIIAKLPITGAGAPDHMTYSIILNAIRFGAFGRNAEDISAEQLMERRDKAVQEGRTLWRDVIARWRSGEVKIDEELVGTMGRLLLISRRMQDWDDILDLIRQTLQIERLVLPLGHPDRNAQHVPQDQDTLESRAEPEEDNEGYQDAPSTKAFHPIQPYPKDPAHPKRPTTLAWVQPGNATLSLLIEACTSLRIPKTAMAYWNHLTSEHALKPDLPNYHAQLKLLSINRSSASAATLLKEMNELGIEPKNQTFRIAMSVCMRDKKNHNVLSHARSIVDLMEATQADLDIHTLIQYLNLALMTDDGTKIAATLDRLDPIVHNLRSQLSYGTEGTGSHSHAQHLVDNEEIVKFLRTMVGVIDTLMNKGMVPRDDFENWHGRRGQLTDFIGRAKGTIEKQRANIDTTEAEKVARKHAKEAGRMERRRRYDDQGKVEPRMSKDEWQLKVFRRNEEKEKYRGERRTKAAGLLRWDHRQLREQPGFGDSPMDLAER